MDTLTTHPATAQQATAFTSPSSLSFPGGAGELTPPSEKDGNSQANGASGQINGASGAYQGGQQLQKGVDASSNGNGVTPTTPAATPGAGTSVGIGTATFSSPCAEVSLLTPSQYLPCSEYSPCHASSCFEA